MKSFYLFIKYWLKEIYWRAYKVYIFTVMVLTNKG